MKQLDRLEFIIDCKGRQSYFLLILLIKLRNGYFQFPGRIVHRKNARYTVYTEMPHWTNVQNINIDATFQSKSMEFAKYARCQVPPYKGKEKIFL